MPLKDVHMQFKDCVSLSLLSAAFNKSFPHFRSQCETEPVEHDGKTDREIVFRTLKDFSTAFPQPMWKDKESI